MTDTNSDPAAKPMGKPADGSAPSSQPVVERPVETIQFDDMTATIRRLSTPETYIALQPPDAIPYIVAPLDKPPDEIVAFVIQWIEVIRELRADMLKHFQKTKSLKCRYQTGDIAYLFGRPYMLRVYPVASTMGRKKGTRGRANVSAAVRPEVSVIDLFLIRTRDYDQGRMAFLSLAKPVFLRNVQSLAEQCMARVFDDDKLPKSIAVRPLRSDWIRVDQTKDTVWVSENLIPYPPECFIYAFLNEMIKVLLPEADESERIALLDKGLPGWQEYREILADSNSVYSNQ
ncbi:MAG: DUF45 domain-containing protein [Coriobacteriia bacterium]|nr:DUF45 domain-containing protein [Coriobacteriia bacterium]